VTEEILLEVAELVTTFATEAGMVGAVDGVSFAVRRGRTLGIVGESGCGKSVTALSIMRLLPKPAGRIAGGRILFDGLDLARLTADRMRTLRGNRLSMIFQEPMTALNPVQRIEKQLQEAVNRHQPRLAAAKPSAGVIEILKQVGLPAPEQRLKEYPHQLSGGMRQRVMIGMALACRPEILIADEPTTALDVTIQAQILALMKERQRETGMAIVFITHDLGVIAEMCDDVVVMYAGQVVERASVLELFANPVHPYTIGLLESIPRLEAAPKCKLAVIEGMVPDLQDLPQGCRFQNRCRYAEPRCQTAMPAEETVGNGHRVRCFRWREIPMLTKPGPLPSLNGESEPIPDQRSIEPEKPEPLLQVENLKLHFPLLGGILRRRIGWVYALAGVSLTVARGETVGLVGESGCGKTTWGRTLMRLYDPSAGQIHFRGRDITRLTQREIRPLRREMQMMFQDPFESLNSRHTVGEILEEPFIIHRLGTPAERQRQVQILLEKVGLSATATRRYPHEFSGGQRQRIGIARAIALNPRLIVCDEPVSALDVSIQSQILNLLLALQVEMGLTYLFIAHDLAVVRHVSDRIAVMYLGRIVELTTAAEVYARPLHPYTQALISAVPVPDPRVTRSKIILSGEVPSPIQPPAGCHFHPRCPVARDLCRVRVPSLTPFDGDAAHLVACHFAGEVDLLTTPGALQTEKQRRV